MKARLVLINAAVLIGILLALEAAASFYYGFRGSGELAISRLTSSIAAKIKTRGFASLQTAKDPTSGCPTIMSTVKTGTEPSIQHPLLGSFYSPNSLYTTTIKLSRSESGINPDPNQQRLSAGVDTYVWRHQTGPYGNRLASIQQLRPGIPVDGKLILILGDSFMHGHAVDDEGSFAWVLQSLLPSHNVYNFALGGAGTVHQAIMLRDATSDNKLIPREIAQNMTEGKVILGYADFYLPRNVLAPSRLREQAYSHKCAGQAAATKASAIPEIKPRARINKDTNAIEIEAVELRELRKTMYSDSDPDALYQAGVGIALMKDALNNINKLGAKPIVAYVRGKDDDKVIRWLRSEGVPVVDLRPSKTVYDYDYLLPFDGHAGYIAHNMWAKKILKALQAL